MLLGKNRVVKVFGHFSSGRKYCSKGSPEISTSICEKFYVGDGLHLNTTGSKLLGALISKTIARASQRDKMDPDTNTIIQKKSEATCSGSGSVPETHQPVRTYINFTENHTPPPPTDNLNHFPHLTQPTAGADIVHGVPVENGWKRSGVVLTGYSDAVKKVPAVKTEVNKSTSLPTRQKRTCKLMIMIL